MTLPSNAIIVVGGGLAGLSAAHQVYQRGGNVVLLDKQDFLSGNSGKATLGINGAGTHTQLDSANIHDLAKQFYDDLVATAKDRANPGLLRVLTYKLAEAVHWLQDDFGLDLLVVSRLGGHSQPRTHRGRDLKFPGMAITYRLLETLEELAESEPHRVAILKKSQVLDLVREDGVVTGVHYKNLDTKEYYDVLGPVILSTGGYAADFTRNSLLRKHRPDIIDLPLTNGVHATGDGQKIVMKNHGAAVDMDKVQVHPTGLIDLDDRDTISGKLAPRFLFLGAEALRGEGGLIFNADGHRFVDELGPRDHVSGEMEKQVAAGKGPLRLVLSEAMGAQLEFHIKHYHQRNLMKTVTGAELAQEIGCAPDVLAGEIAKYNRAALGEEKDPFGKRFFPNVPVKWDPEAKYYMSYITRVLHFTMGGVKIDERLRVIQELGEPFEGLYAAGEVAGGVHGHNRLGGSLLLACVVFGRLAADQALAFAMEKLAAGRLAAARLDMINVHVDQSSRRVVIDFGESGAGEGGESGDKGVNKHERKPAEPFVIPDKEFTLEEIAKHNTPGDCWCIIKNVVVDLTQFAKHHPGGEHLITTYAGRDATELFVMLHADNFILKYVPKNVLGVVKGTKSELKV